MNPLTQVVVHNLSFYNKSKEKKVPYVNARNFFLAHCMCVVFFFRTVDLCRIIFSPSHFVRRKLVGPSVFCLKMPPGYPFVLQFVSIRRPQRPQRYKRIYDKRQNNCRLVLKSFMYNCNLTKIHVTVIAIEYLEHKQINSIVLAIPCLQLRQTRTKLYTLFMTEREETISCPAAHNNNNI